MYLKKTIELLEEVYNDNRLIVLKEFDENKKSTFLMNTIDILPNFIENIKVHRIFTYIETIEISPEKVKETIKSTEIIEVLNKMKDSINYVNNYEYFDYDITAYNFEKTYANIEEIVPFTYDNMNDYAKYETAYLCYTTKALVEAFLYIAILKILQLSENGRSVDLLKKLNEEKHTVNIFASKEIEKLSKLRKLYSSKNVIIFVCLANALNLTKEQSLSLSRKLKLNNGKTFKTKFDEFQNILFPNNKYLQ